MRTLLLALLALIFHAVPAGADDFDFKLTRYAFLPELTVSNDDAVCRPFLEAVTAAFKGPDYRIDLAGSAWPGVATRWIFPVPDTDTAQFLLRDVPADAPDGGYKTHVQALPIDLDGDGKREVLANVFGIFNWQGDWHALALFSSQDDFDRTIRSSKKSDAFFEGAIAPRPNEPILSGGKSILTTWAEREVVAVNDVPYVLSRGEVYQDDALFTLRRIHADASTDDTCEVQALPDRKGMSLASLQSGPVGDFAALVSLVSGEEAGGGTLHAQSRLLLDAGRVLSRLAVRPWVLGKADLYNTRAVVDDDLDAWARSGLYNFRLRRAWPEQEAAARTALATYYQQQYGLAPNAAAGFAAQALDVLVRSYFVFPSGGIPALPDQPYRGLTQALLEGAPRTEIERLLQGGYKIRTRANMGKDPEDGKNVWGYFTEEPTLFYALEDPVNVVVLLRAGADPNAKGNFDKTALMYAAQFDLVDTAKLLLASGADVNAVTTADGMETLGGRTQRRALMYAAENASPDLIRLLLARGADATAEDSTRRGVLYYLGLNQRISAEDQAVLAAELTAAGATP